MLQSPVASIDSERTLIGDNAAERAAGDEYESVAQVVDDGAAADHGAPFARVTVPSSVPLPTFSVAPVLSSRPASVTPVVLPRDRAYVVGGEGIRPG